MERFDDLEAALNTESAQLKTGAGKKPKQGRKR
jgi:hypothetical protein